jgi:hypothetical protein
MLVLIGDEIINYSLRKGKPLVTQKQGLFLFSRDSQMV